MIFTGDKKMKKIIGIIMMLLMVATTLPLAFADNVTDDENTSTANRGSLQRQARARALQAGQNMRNFGNNQGIGKEVREMAQQQGQNGTPRLIAAFAHSKRLERVFNHSPKARGIVGNLTEEKARVFGKLTRGQQNKLLGKGKDLAIKELGKYKLKPIDMKKLFKKRVIAKEKIAFAKEKFEKAKGNYLRLNNKYKEKKGLYQDARDRLKGCKDSDNETCEEIEAEIQANAQEFVINGGNMAIEHLEKIKQKVEASEDMDEDVVLDIIAKLDETIANIQDAIAKAEAAETKTELQEAAREIGAVLKRTRNKERAYAASLVNAKVWNVIKRSEHLEKKLDTTLDRMAEKNITVEDIETKVDAFSDKITSAKDKYEDAKEILTEVREMNKEDVDKEEVHALVENARGLLKEAHEELKEAHKMLVDIVKDIKQAGGKLVEAEEEYEVVEE